ncbi:MAG: lipopolysaccharide biosynthesis protein [Alphaproteobacteria bacterium]|nr:lipopolysaccharide biosynthesis protein [Alphaproteobacteria bacterium]
MSGQSEAPSGQSPSVVTLGKLATSSLWIVGARWLLRCIGLVSTVIFVRILTPRDFGIVALATLVMGLLEVFSEAGQRLALIRLQRIERDHYDTAWTLGVVIGVVIAVAMLAAGPVAGRYFDEPELGLVIQVLALRPLLLGFENIGTVDFRRDLRFDMELKLLLWPKIVTFGITLALVWWLRDYWALVFGIVAGQAVAIVFSYVLHPYRPRFSMAKLTELWGFSAWILLATFGRYCSERADEVVIGRRFEAQQLGVYSVVGSTAAMPVEELTTPVARALYSGFSRLRDDPPALRRTYLDALSVLYAVAIAASFGIAAIAHDLVLVLLGAKWLDGVALVAPLAIAAASIGVGVTNNALANALGRTSWVAGRTWALALVLILAMVVVPTSYGITGIAVARVGAALLVTLVMQVMVARLVDVDIGAVFETIWRPLVTAGVVYAAIRWGIAPLLQPGVVRLSICVASGAALTVIVQLGLWLLAGRPRGVEAFAITLLERGRAAMRT